jgi:hypothetical protein
MDCARQVARHVEVIEAFRARLRRMSDAKLLEYGQAGAFLCRPEQCVNGKPRGKFRHTAAGNAGGVAPATSQNKLTDDRPNHKMLWFSPVQKFFAAVSF